MANTLIIVTFLAGGSWGPAVTFLPTSSGMACEALQESVAEMLLVTAKSNVQFAEIERVEKVVMVVAGQSRRVFATLKCD